MANMKRGMKRTVDAEYRAFNESWAIKYFFVKFKSKPMCVICNEIVSIKKEYNIKQHYDMKQDVWRLHQRPEGRKACSIVKVYF